VTRSLHGGGKAIAVVAAVLLTVLTGALVAGCGQQAEAGGAAYAALGDSFSSGAGIAPVRDQVCRRSGVDYPELVARKLGYRSFDDVTCAGARTTHLVQAQVTAAGTNAPQLEALGPDTRLVTLTIGINDKALAYALLGACLSPAGGVPQPCRDLLAAGAAATDKALSDAADRVAKALALIRRTAPEARVVLVGYPHYFPDSGSCPDRVPVLEQWVPRARAILEAVNEKWKAVAGAAGVDYLDTWAMSEGHDVCSADPWLNGSTERPGVAAALHPFAGFHRAVADAVVALVEGR
jgi:lysophospholipase L1-like esterase